MHDEPGRSDEEGRPDEGNEDTRPLWERGPQQQPQQQPYPQHAPQQAPGQPYPQTPSAQANPYAQHTRPLPYYPQAAPPQKSTTVPGWIWPVVAATAFVVGLLGGTLGGVAVSSSMNDDGAGVLELGTGQDAPLPAPLDPNNRNVAAVASQLLPSTVQIRAREDGEEGEETARGATGSGFVLDPEGHVITNNHVVAGAAEGGAIEVVDENGTVRTAEIVGRSPVYDIAVLELEDAGRLRPAAIGSSTSMNVGETVVAIGSPLGLDSTVTSGIISALDRPVTTGEQDDSSYINAVQTDAAINPGNSGGPLVNLRGQVVGVNSAIATTGGFGGGAGNIGVGFAIPMEQVRITATQILQTGEARYPIIGADVMTGGGGDDGAEVTSVRSGAPAEDAGLERGDVVVGVDKVDVTDGIGLIVAIRSHQPGETIALKVQRDGQDITVRVRLDGEVG